MRFIKLFSKKWIKYETVPSTSVQSLSGVVLMFGWSRETSSFLSFGYIWLVFILTKVHIHTTIFTHGVTFTHTQPGGFSFVTRGEAGSSSSSSSPSLSPFSVLQRKTSDEIITLEVGSIWQKCIAENVILHFPFIRRLSHSCFYRQWTVYYIMDSSQHIYLDGAAQFNFNFISDWFWFYDDNFPLLFINFLFV